MDYATGETIYHPQHGLGELKKFDTKEMLGTEYKFAILFFPRQQLEISLPAKNLETTVRKPLGEAKATALLEQMDEVEMVLDKNWKSRNRNNLERLSSGDPMEIFHVFQGLSAIKTQKGSLNNSDRKMHQLSLDLLVEELSYALNKTDDEITTILEGRATASAA